VIKSFKITVKDKFLKSNNTHYGIVGNSINYTSNQNEFVNDNISKIFIGYGFYK